MTGEYPGAEPSVGPKNPAKEEAKGYLWAQDSWALDNSVYAPLCKGVIGLITHT